MKGARLAAMAILSVAAPVVAAACGDDSESADTLPPLLTTTTTTTLLITTTTTITYYEVQPGDTLHQIATRFGVDQAQLMALNGITDPDHIEAGEVLQIPPPLQVVSTLPAATSSTLAP